MRISNQNWLDARAAAHNFCGMYFLIMSDNPYSYGFTGCLPKDFKWIDWLDAEIVDGNFDPRYLPLIRNGAVVAAVSELCDSYEENEMYSEVATIARKNIQDSWAMDIACVKLFVDSLEAVDSLLVRKNAEAVFDVLVKDWWVSVLRIHS